MLSLKLFLSQDQHLQSEVSEQTHTPKWFKMQTLKTENVELEPLGSLHPLFQNHAHAFVVVTLPSLTTNKLVLDMTSRNMIG